MKSSFVSITKIREITENNLPDETELLINEINKQIEISANIGKWYTSIDYINYRCTELQIQNIIKELKACGYSVVQDSSIPIPLLHISWGCNDSIKQSEPIAENMRRNGIFVDECLGNSFTKEQYESIINSTFKDMYIGSYWDMDGVNYRIARFNENSIDIIPDTILYETVMNDIDSNEGGYLESKMHEEGLNEAKDMIEKAFGVQINNLSLMSKDMLFGEDNQLSLFRLKPECVKSNRWYWLSDPVASTSFALVAHSGFANYYIAAYSFGVRPVFTIS